MNEEKSKTHYCKKLQMDILVERPPYGMPGKTIVHCEHYAASNVMGRRDFHPCILNKEKARFETCPVEKKGVEERVLRNL